MNVLDQLTIKRTPFKFAYVIEEIDMKPQEISILPALVSELVNMSISTVKPLMKVGRVMVFDVAPHKLQDPPCIFCKAVDLKEYYFIWREVVNRDWSFTQNRIMCLYDEMINALNISKLDIDEAAFLLVELLKFKNEYVRLAW